MKTIKRIKQRPNEQNRERDVIVAQNEQGREREVAAVLIRVRNNGRMK
jgi:hypothetical protein